MFIGIQPHRSSENYPEQNWSSQEATSSTIYYRGQQLRSFNQPSQYNDRQQYHHNITLQKAFLFNTH